MAVWIVVLLGIVQGVTEFLPISSSAHLRITAALAGWDDPGAAFTAVSQIGTELAVVLYFRRKIVKIITSWTQSLYKPEYRHDPDARIGWLIIVGSMPIVILGLLFEEQIDSAFRDLRLVATVLIFFGVAPEEQKELVDALAQPDEWLMTVPGYRSHSIHRSIDDTQVVLYAQWESKQSHDAFHNLPEDERPEWVQEQRGLIQALATSRDAGTYRVVHTRSAGTH
jgi:heme-degrading monooxygenase HmoA